jgi:hypothetical protein
MLKCKHCNEENQTKFYPNLNRNQCIECYRKNAKKRGKECRSLDIDNKLKRKECLTCKKEVIEHNTHHFEWNHRDPNEKLYNVCKVVSKKKVYEEEIKKCDLLCLFCHADVTKQQHKDGIFRSRPRVYA